jgi:adenosylcobinamide-phosphate synthase
MSFIEPILAGMLTRAETLVPLLVAALLVGEILARISGVAWLMEASGRVAAWLERKLNRENRGVATRVYRGMVALGMLLLPALVLGVLLARDNQISHLCTLLLLPALMGDGLAPIRQFRNWRRASQGALPLTLPGLDFLFADSHAVKRYLMLTQAERFAVNVVGVALWYMLGGMALVLAYLAVAQCARYGNGAAFGWAASALFGLMDALPRGLTCLLLTLAAIFTTGAKPWRVFAARRFHGFVAALTDVSLGGTLPGRELPWAGTGTPKATATHLARWGLMEMTALVLLVLALSGRQMLVG